MDSSHIGVFRRARNTVLTLVDVEHTVQVEKVAVEVETIVLVTVDEGLCRRVGARKGRARWGEQGNCQLVDQCRGYRDGRDDNDTGCGGCGVVGG